MAGVPVNLHIGPRRLPQPDMNRVSNLDGGPARWNDGHILTSFFQRVTVPFECNTSNGTAILARVAESQ